MAGFTNTIENAVLNHIFGRTTYTAPATFYTGVYTADYMIPEDKEGQFDYEFSGSLGSRTIVGRSSFSANWR